MTENWTERRFFVQTGRINTYSHWSTLTAPLTPSLLLLSRLFFFMLSILFRTDLAALQREQRGRHHDSIYRIITIVQVCGIKISANTADGHMWPHSSHHSELLRLNFRLLMYQRHPWIPAGTIKHRAVVLCASFFGCLRVNNQSVIDGIITWTHLSFYVTAFTARPSPHMSGGFSYLVLMPSNMLEASYLLVTLVSLVLLLSRPPDTHTHTHGRNYNL